MSLSAEQIRNMDLAEVELLEVCGEAYKSLARIKRVRLQGVTADQEKNMAEMEEQVIDGLLYATTTLDQINDLRVGGGL